MKGPMAYFMNRRTSPELHVSADIVDAVLVIDLRAFEAQHKLGGFGPIDVFVANATVAADLRIQLRRGRAGQSSGYAGATPATASL